MSSFLLKLICSKQRLRNVTGRSKSKDIISRVNNSTQTDNSNTPCNCSIASPPKAARSSNFHSERASFIANYSSFLRIEKDPGITPLVSEATYNELFENPPRKRGAPFRVLKRDSRVKLVPVTPLNGRRSRAASRLQFRCWLNDLN